MNDVKCPKCGSEDVFQKKDGNCLCGACGHRFMPQQEPAEFVPMRLFISYGHKESEICRRIYQALKDRGHDPWFDERRICFGNDWRERIANGIEKSGSVVACLSQYSMREKGVCLDELAISVGVKGGNIVSILLEDVNPPASVSHKQWLDMRGWREKLDSGEDVFQPWFDAKMAELYAVLESKENREFSGQITELKKRLTVYYSTSRQEKLLRNAFIGREWVDAAVSRWLQDDSAPRTCLLTGAPGVGKSAYAAHFTHYNGSVAAALFCSSDMDTFNNPRTVIQTLAYLMACRLPAYRQSLMLHLPEDRASVQSLSEKELFEQLISKPLSLCVDGNHERMILLLDGFDECGSPENNVLAKTLYEYADSLPDWLRILLVARDIPAISVYTKGVYRIEIGSESKDNLQDIRDYYRFELESRFGDDPQWADALERMTARSQGIFLYAQMLTDLLRSRGTLGAVEEYPDGLDAVFTVWFDWFFSESDFRSFWRPAIGCILGAPAPLPAETLRRVMHWGENELADFRARLKVLLRVEKNEFDEETLVFDHAFVREWLTRGAGENVYFCSPKDGAQKLAGELYAIFERDPEELSFWEAVHLMDLPLGEKQREKALESFELDNQVKYAGAYCDIWGKYDQEERIFDKALLVAEERDKKLANDDSRLVVVFYLKCKSDIMFTRGKVTQSVKLEEDIFSIVQGITEKNPTNENQKNLSTSYSRIGDRLKSLGKNNNAMKMYKKSLAIRERLNDELGTPQSQSDLSQNYKSVGTILKTQGKYSYAMKMYKKSLTIDEELNTELSTQQSQRDLAVSYNLVGDILREQGDLIGALEMYNKSLVIFDKLSFELDTPQSRCDLSVGYERVGVILRRQGDFVGALEMYRKGLAICEKLSLELGTPQSRKDLAVSYNLVGGILQEQSDFIGALEMYRKSLAICEKLSLELDTSQSRRDLAVSYTLVGGILKKQGGLIGALEMYRKNLVLREKLSLELDTSQSWRNLSVGYERVGDILQEQSDFIGALEMYRKSLAICEKLSLELDTSQSRRDLAVSYTLVGGILKKQGGLIGALEMYRKNLVLREKLSLELDTSQSWRNLSVGYERVGFILREQGNFIGALEMYRKSLAIDEKLSLELRTPSECQDVMITCTHIVCSLFDMEKYDEALPFAKKALTIGEALAAQLNTDAARKEAEMMRENLKELEAHCKKS